MFKYLLALILFGSSPLLMADEPRTLTLFGRQTLPSLDVTLSDQDWRWLGKKQQVTIATWDSENPPLDIELDSGTYEGIFADYLKLIVSNLGIRCHVIRFSDRKQALQALIAGKVDIMVDDPGVKDTLPSSIIASSTLMSNRPAMVSHQSTDFKFDGSQTFSLAVAEDYLSDTAIKSLYPTAKIVRFNDNSEALSSVAFHRTDAALGNLTSVSFLIDRNFNNDLKIESVFPQTGSNGRFLLRRNESSLIAGVNAVIAAMPAPLAESITDAWFLASDYAWLSRPTSLSAHEQAWIKAHPVIDVVANPLYVPLTVQDRDNVFHGISSDVLHLISLRTGLKFRLRPVTAINDMISEVSRHKASMLAAITWSSQRAHSMALTRPYLFSSYVLIVPDRPGAIADIKPGMRIAVTVGNTMAEDLQKLYPQVHVVNVTNASLALKMVEEGKVDAAVHTQTNADFLISRYFEGKLKIGSQVGTRRAEISFAVNRQERELESILNKTLAEIPPGNWQKSLSSGKGSLLLISKHGETTRPGILLH